MSQFAFLQREWPAVHDAAGRAESAVYSDLRTACCYVRRALELAVAWAYEYDPALKLPYQDNLSALIPEPSFKQAAGEAVFNKARVINTLGNRAVHGHHAIPQISPGGRRGSRTPKRRSNSFSAISAYRGSPPPTTSRP